jgi:hypothetical protein
VILAGIFNRHYHQWGGDEVSRSRQGEVDLIIELMSEHALQSLLPRGPKCGRMVGHKSTINLILAEEGLTSMV